jgi:hypothetical protein
MPTVITRGAASAKAFGFGGGISYPPFSTLALTNSSTSIYSTSTGTSWNNYPTGVAVSNGGIQNIVCYNGTNFVLAPYFGSVYYSNNGYNWSAVSAPTTTSISGLIWNGSVFCLTSYGTGSFSTSADGINWSSSANPNTSYGWDCIGHKGSTILVMGTNSSLTTWYSAISTNNGASWSVSGNSGQLVPSAIASNSSTWVFTGGAQNSTYASGNGIYSSTNGSSWSNQVSDASVYFTFVVWSPSLNLFVAGGAGTSGAGYYTSTYYTSSDGISWTSRNFPVSGYWQTLVWDSALSLFIIYEANSSYIYYSSNGTSWTKGSNLSSVQNLCSKTLV